MHPSAHQQLYSHGCEKGISKCIHTHFYYTNGAGERFATAKSISNTPLISYFFSEAKIKKKKNAFMKFLLKYLAVRKCKLWRPVHTVLLSLSGFILVSDDLTSLKGGLHTALPSLSLLHSLDEDVSRCCRSSTCRLLFFFRHDRIGALVQKTNGGLAKESQHLTLFVQHQQCVLHFFLNL